VPLLTLRWVLDCNLNDYDIEFVKKISTYIHLTDCGTEILNKYRAINKNTDESELLFAIFTIFYSDELLIDIFKTDASSLQIEIHEEIRRGKFKYPWIYDRELYDKFFANFNSTPNVLTYDETKLLLKNCQEGVFQAGKLTIGPCGILESSTERVLLPTLKVNLYHCPDPSCNVIHEVLLCKVAGEIALVRKKISGLIKSIYGEQSQWLSLFDDFIDSPKTYFDDYNKAEFPYLLTNAFCENELKVIFTELLDQFPKHIRAEVNSKCSVKYTKIFKNSPFDVSAKLTRSECFQIMLLETTEHISYVIEKLIEDGRIIIPNSEIRQNVVNYRLRTGFTVKWQVSRYGVRAISEKSQLSIGRLKKLITKIYPTEDDKTELSWILERDENKSLAEKLEKYIHNENPKDIIKNTVLRTPGRLQGALKYLNYGKYEVPKTPSEEEWLIEKILWKLGFNIRLYPIYQKQFWDRYNKFQSSALTYISYNETDFEIIRGAAGNFFVSLEEILDLSLTFVSWVLLSDHFIDTKYCFKVDEARNLMASKLTMASTMYCNYNDKIIFNSAGANTLYPLIQGFKILSSLCKHLRENESSSYHRVSEEYPLFSSYTNLQKFPFKHKLLLFDLNYDEFNSLINSLAEVTYLLDQAKVCDIRNRINHKREFPTQDEIESVLLALNKVVNKLEILGICPCQFHFISAIIDQYNRRANILHDYKGRQASFNSPSQFQYIHLPQITDPVLVVSCLHFPESNAKLTFTLSEPSNYTKLWHDFPKKRLSSTK